MVEGVGNQPGLDRPTKGLVSLAAAIAQGEESAIREMAAAAIEAATPAIWVDELLLQSVLMVGWPRALVAAGIWRKNNPIANGAPSEDTGYEAHRDWTQRGEQICRTVYGDNYQKLRDNQRALHPELDQWMLTEGYGRTLSRPGLELAKRELCVVAQTAVLSTHRQLHSHLRGALNAGATPAMVNATLAIVNSLVSHDDWKAIKELWERVKEGWSEAS